MNTLLPIRGLPKLPLPPIFTPMVTPWQGIVIVEGEGQSEIPIPKIHEVKADAIVKHCPVRRHVLSHEH